MRKHPRGTYAFVWSCDLAALLLVAVSLYLTPLSALSGSAWTDFAVWTAIVCVARLGVVSLVGLSVSAGWFQAIEFAMVIVLPFPLFTLAIAISYGLVIIDRIRRKHHEPLLGPDFNAANVILAAGAANLTYRTVSGALPPSLAYGSTVAVLPAALVFFALHTLLLIVLLSIDERKPWRKVGCLDADALVSDGMMLTAGALLGRLYQEDSSLLLLTFVPLLFLHKALGRLNEAKLAYVDGKTGLYNYRFLDEALNDRFRKAHHAKRPLALVFGDMDHLRDVNNTYGHQAGDKALAAVAKAFLEEAGTEAIAARFGGEEFVLMIPGCDKARAAEAAERVRRAVAATLVPIEGGDQIRITVSLGVAAFPEDAASVEELVKNADEAVYQAKHSGRNRVCLYGGRKVALH